tara:strand:- start:265 stop:942 length:678 start_codon:yes stop_codon:yes gene_type:complete
MGWNYVYNEATGKSEPSGSAYSGGDGAYIVSGSTVYADGAHILDSGGDQRITFTDAGSTLFKDDGGTTGITLDASNNTTIAGTLTSTGLITGNAGLAADNFTVSDTTGNTAIGGTLKIGGHSAVVIEDTLSDAPSQAESQAISLTTVETQLTTDADADAATLADGAEGQIKVITLKTDGGGNMVITPTNLEGYSTITMADAKDRVALIFSQTKWVVISNDGCTLA